MVSYLGSADEARRRGVLQAAGGFDPDSQLPLPELGDAPAAEPDWVEVDVKRVRIERSREFGGPWVGLQVAERLGLPEFLRAQVSTGGEEIPWPLMALVLVLGRLCEPGSELSLADRDYKRTALPELLGVPVAKVNDDRLYRALDRLLPAKAALEKHLADRLGQLFDLKYDLLLYDVTSTFFEGQAAKNPLAQRGYSRDQRPDCKQVCIALVVSREGIPLGYEVFAGNRTDVTTVEEIVEQIERQYGTAERVWVMDRGMVSEENLEFLRERQRQYIVGTPKAQLRRFEADLLSEGWTAIRDGLEVKLCQGPEGAETFILCRSADRRAKEQAMHERAAEKLEAQLQALAAACAKRTRPQEAPTGETGSGVGEVAPARKLTARAQARAAQRAEKAAAEKAEKTAQVVKAVERRIGRLLEKYSRAAKLFTIEARSTPEGEIAVTWTRNPKWNEWAELSDGCYLLRTNIRNWSAEQLWKAYIQLTEAEAAFRIQKSDLQLRPIWHQKEERVRAHILVCFLSYVIWKTLGKMCQAAGLGDCPRTIFDELSQLRTVDVVLPTRQGVEIRKRCVERPDPQQAILLQRLKVQVPESLPVHDM